jgi:RND family efflux transporter MFP subunit
MRQGGASSRARLDDAIHAHARAQAGMREAAVAVRRAELDLERSEIRAPFAGRVREKHVDRGQYVSRGVPVARVYSVTYAEVRLPISDADLAFLDVPLDVPLAGGIDEGRDESASDSPAGDDTRGGPPVVLSAEFAGATHEWTGRIVRTEGALDARTRMVNVVARVDDPYGREQKAGRPPLPVGLFIHASIEGRVFEGIYEVPRSALRRRDEVWVVSDDNRLEKRRVSVLRSIGDQTFIRAGISPGEAIVTSALEIATDGMRVRTVEIPAAPSATPETAAAPVPS